MFTLVFVGVFTTVTMVGDEAVTNDNLDDDSKQMLISVNYELGENFNRSDYEETELNVSENSSFEGVDPFARDYLETQAAADKRTNAVQRITRVPDLIITSLGIPESFVGPIKAVVLTLFGVFLSIATFNALRRGIVSRR